MIRQIFFVLGIALCVLLAWSNYRGLVYLGMHQPGRWAPQGQGLYHK